MGEGLRVRCGLRHLDRLARRPSIARANAPLSELVARFAIRSTVLPPAAITMLADDAEVVDLTPLRYVRSITAPLSPLQARPRS